VKRVLERVLAEIPKERYEVELSLIPQIRYEMDSGAKQRLRNVITRHK